MASRFFKTGSTSWNNANSWSATSAGGLDNAGVPTAADEVIFELLSGNCTIDVTPAVCRSIDCDGAGTGVGSYGGTLTHNASTILTIGDATAGTGNIALRFVAGMAYTLGSTTTSAIAFVSTSTTQQDVDFASKTTGNVTYNGVGGSWKLTGTHNTNATATVTLTNGTLNTNGQTGSWGLFNTSNSFTRNLTLGASSITITGTGTAWDITTATNLTFNADTSIITCSANMTFQGGAKTYNEVRFTSTSSSAATIQGANTFAILQRTNTSGNVILLISADQIVTSALTFTGNNAFSQRLWVGASDSFSFSTGTKRTITCNGSITLTNVDFVDIIGAGSATWSGTSIGNCGNNSGITFTGAVTRYWVGDNGNYHATTNWSTSSGGSSGASMPLPQDTAIFDANSITTTGRVIDTLNGLRVGTVNFTGVLNSPTFGHGTFVTHFFGSITFISAMTLSSHHHLRGRGTHTVTTGGQSMSTNLLEYDCGTGNYTFQDDFTANASVHYKSGTINGGSANFSLTGFFFNGGVTRTVNMGSGTWTLTGTGVWSGSSFANVTINSNTSTIKLTDNSASNKTFGFSGGGPYTYNKLWIATAGSGRVEIFRTNTFTTLQIDAGAIVRFPSTLTQTIGTWTATGASGNVITIDSSTGGSAATLSKSSGTVSSDWLSLKDSTATGGASWYAGANSTNVSGNSGWIFTAPPGGKNLALLGIG